MTKNAVELYSHINNATALLQLYAAEIRIEYSRKAYDTIIKTQKPNRVL